MLFKTALVHAKIKISKKFFRTRIHSQFSIQRKTLLSKILTSCKNQVCTPHIRKVTYNLNSHNVSMLLKRGVIHAKIKN